MGLWAPLGLVEISFAKDKKRKVISYPFAFALGTKKWINTDLYIGLSGFIRFSSNEFTEIDDFVSGAQFGGLMDINSFFYAGMGAQWQKRPQIFLGMKFSEWSKLKGSFTED